MTMPQMMNCGHRDDGHCLDCVVAEYHRREGEELELGTRVAELEHAWRNTKAERERLKAKVLARFDYLPRHELDELAALFEEKP